MDLLRRSSPVPWRVFVEALQGLQVASRLDGRPVPPQEVDALRRVRAAGQALPAATTVFVTWGAARPGTSGYIPATAQEALLHVFLGESLASRVVMPPLPKHPTWIFHGLLRRKWRILPLLRLRKVNPQLLLSLSPRPLRCPHPPMARVCPACAIIIPRGFCYCTACECEFISSGKFVIHVDDDEPKPSDTTNVTEEVKQVQREAKEDAERFVAEEERPDTQEMSEERSAGRPYIRRISGRTSTTKMREFVRTNQRRMRTQSISCKSRPSALTKPARHHTSLDSLASCFSKCGRYLPTTRQMWSRSLAKKADYTVPTSRSTGGKVGFSKMSIKRTFQSRQPMKRSLPLLSSRM